MFSIQSFEDFCLWLYVTIDDWYQQEPPQLRRPGPAPSNCSDSELLTMVLVGEAAGWQQETKLWLRWQQHRDLFPQLTSLSLLNRRRRLLEGCLQAFQQDVLKHFAWAQDHILLLDSVPVAVVSCAHAAHASHDWRIHQASYGYSHTKRLSFFGYWLHVLVTHGGVILDWVLIPASVGEVKAATDLLHHTACPLSGRWVLADKGYTSTPLRESILAARAAHLLVLPKRDMRAAHDFPLPVHRRFAQVRQRIETVNSQLDQQFGVEQTTAHSFKGLTTRLRAKLIAHLCCVYANLDLGGSRDNALKIRHLAHAP